MLETDINTQAQEPDRTLTVVKDLLRTYQRQPGKHDAKVSGTMAAFLNFLSERYLPDTVHQEVKEIMDMWWTYRHGHSS